MVFAFHGGGLKIFLSLCILNIAEYRIQNGKKLLISNGTGVKNQIPERNCPISSSNVWRILLH